MQWYLQFPRLWHNYHNTSQTTTAPLRLPQHLSDYHSTSQTIAAPLGLPQRLSGYFDIQVPQGHIWVAGDNADASHDSRHYGPVPMALVEGRVMYQVPISLLPVSNSHSSAIGTDTQSWTSSCYCSLYRGILFVLLCLNWVLSVSDSWVYEWCM